MLNLERLTLIYLASPLLLFNTCWLAPPLAGASDLACLAGLMLLWRGNPANGHVRAGTAALALGLAAVWSALGGAGHFFYANYYDWSVRDAVLRDLVVHQWPVVYSGQSGADVFLRCPLSYYLIPAALGKLVGLYWTDLLLYGWTVLGICLVLCWFVRAMPSDVSPWLGWMVFILFSGLDFVGWWVTGRPVRLLNDTHLEWWAGAFQYSSNSTLLFWVPNHALPGWLVGLWFYCNRDKNRTLAQAPVWIALTILWSPLVTVGLAALWVCLAVSRAGTMRIWLGELPTCTNLFIGIAALPAAAYLLVPSGDSSLTLSGSYEKLNADVFIALWYIFISVEFGLFVLVAWSALKHPLTWSVLTVLCLLPFVRFGPGNDIVMRGGIAALAILCAFLVNALFDPRSQLSKSRRLVLGLLLVVGAITPLHEIDRALTRPRWSPDLDTDLVQITKGKAPHYLAPLSHAPKWLALARPE